MNCPICNGLMKPLLTSWCCPKDCDSPTPLSALGKAVLSCSQEPWNSNQTAGETLNYRALNYRAKYEGVGYVSLVAPTGLTNTKQMCDAILNGVRKFQFIAPITGVVTDVDCEHWNAGGERLYVTTGEEIRIMLIAA